MSLPLPKLPIWMNGPRVTALRAVAVRWWEQCLTWLVAPYRLGDALTAPLAVVDLYAYQRNVNRGLKEPERLYRLRVHYALVNAQDAGNRAGMERIFQRLEMPVYGLAERLAGYDWDMIKLETTLANYISSAEALHIVMQAYRRTCRRWLLEVQAPELTGKQVTTATALTIAESTGTDYVCRATGRPVQAALTILEFA